MAFTVANLKTVVAQSAHKDLSITDHDTTVEIYVLRAIRYIQRFDFECWRNEFTLTLTAGTYIYPYSSSVWPTEALTRPLRIDADSLRRQDSETILEFRQSVAFLDEAVGGGSWKDSASANGTPLWFTERAKSLIIAPKPSSAFVSSSSPLAGYYYRGEDLTTSGFETLDLAMYDDFFEHVVSLAEVFALKQEDDTTFQTQLQYWLQHDLPELRGYDHMIEEDEPIPAPEWAAYIEGADSFIA